MFFQFWWPNNGIYTNIILKQDDINLWREKQSGFKNIVSIFVLYL